jgi:hypothetical protein
VAPAGSLQMMKMAASHPPLEGFRWVRYSSLPSSRLLSIISGARCKIMDLVGAK